MFGALGAGHLVAGRVEDLHDEARITSSSSITRMRLIPCPPVRAAAAGTNSAPRPTSDDTVSVPPCDSAMPRLTDRPSPVPPAARFVVKNGSKMRLERRGLDARAVVATTVTTTGPSSVRTSIATVPPFGIAWRAFAIRLRKICLSWFGLAHDEAHDVVVGVDDLDALVRIRAAHQVDGGLHDVFHLDDVPLLGVLTREVEQGADDLLDLEPRLLDQLEPLTAPSTRAPPP